MTFTELINVLRPLLNDVSKPGIAEIWDDTKYAVMIDDGTRYIYDQFPESRIDSTGALATWAPIDQTNPDSASWLPDAYRQALIEYVCFRFYDTDAGDTRDQTLSATHYKRFISLLSPKVA